MKVSNAIIIVIALFLTACGSSEGNSSESCSAASIAPAMPNQSQTMLDQAIVANGLPYVWGGQSPDMGFDCSGLMLWAAEASGIATHWNDDSGKLVRDVTADVLYRHNSDVISYSDMEPGDIIFFDVDEDGVIEHSSYFVEYGDGEVPLVFDAYSIEGRVKYRYIDGFWDKNPAFARLNIIRPDCN